MKLYNQHIRIGLSRTVIFATIFAVLIAGSVGWFNKQAAADQYDDKIAALQKDIAKYEAQAALLSDQAATLQSALTQIMIDQEKIQAEIALSQAKYDKLVQEIADTEQKIKDNQDALGRTLADMYVDGEITPIEMLASSKNISDYMDKQEYQSSIRDQLTVTIAVVKDLKVELDTQKTDVEVILAQQKAQEATLEASRAEQQRLLDQTKGQEAAYQQLVASNEQKLQDVAAQQRAYYQSLLNSGGGDSGVVGSFQYANWSGNLGCTGGYPWSAIGSWGSQWGCRNGLDVGIDNWQLYNRECVSYAAWAISERFNRQVNGFHGEGNAYEWPSSAPRLSGAVRVYNPQPGDAVVLPRSGNFAPIGHLMVVESEPSDAGWIRVSQYNFYGTGEYSTMDIKSTGVIFLRFPPAL